jgi:hypothetical protein
VAQVRAVSVRPEFRLDEAPAPQRLAPSALALTVETADPEDLDVTGRFVLLHDPDGVDEWSGSYRAVVFARAELESELVDEPMLPDVAWSWVEDALGAAGVHAVQLGGTVTRTAGRSFGTMAERPSDGFVEIRASWTPDETDGTPQDDLGLHVEAWLALVGLCAGLPPVPRGVAHVASARRRR